MENLPAYYAKRAREYEAVYQKPERRQDLVFLEGELTKLLAKRSVLDIGCGTGYWTSPISASAESIYAIDINEAVLQIARKKRYACPIQFEEASYLALDPYEGRFSGAFLGFVFSHILKQEAKAFLDSVFTTLKEGGKLVIVDNLYVPGNSTPISRTDEWGNTYQNRKLKNGESFEVLKNFPDTSAWSHILDNSSFKWTYTSLSYFWMLSIDKI